MTTTLLSPQVTFVQLQNHLEYPEAGVLNKLLFKDNTCQYSLFCLAANTEISEHSAKRNATIHVLEGTGILTLDGETIKLEPGIFVFMPANAPHALEATSNLAFILTLSSAS